MRVDEKELAELGLVINPDNPNEAISARDLADAEPNEDWDVARLARYVAERFTAVTQCEEQILVLTRRTADETFRAGHALHFAQAKLKTTKAWRAWLLENRIPVTTAWEAVEVYRRAKTPEAVAGLTAGEAKQKFGIQKPRKPASHGRPANKKRDEVALITRQGGKKSRGDHLPATEGCGTPNNTTNNAEDGGSISTLPPLPADFHPTDADHTTAIAFVEATGGWTRAAQVFQAEWLRRPDAHETASTDVFEEI